MRDNPERKVLDMVEQGQISAEDGLRLIKAMGNGREANPEQAVPGMEIVEPAGVPDAAEAEIPDLHIPEAEQRRMNRLKRWWVLPFGIGLLITSLGAVWMYLGYTANGFGFGFWLAWLPFLLGIFIVAVSFQTSKSVWLHVRIKQRPGESPQRISISLPMPISLTRWFMTAFGKRIPGLKDQPLENYAEVLDNLSPEAPFYVHVNDDDGEEVEVFIG